MGITAAAAGHQPVGASISRSKPRADGAGIRYALAAIKNVGRTARWNSWSRSARRTARSRICSTSPGASMPGCSTSALAREPGQGRRLRRARTPTAARGWKRSKCCCATPAPLQADEQATRTSLFGEATRAITPLRCRRRPDWPTPGAPAQEFEAVGFYLSGPSAGCLQIELRRSLGVVPWAELWRAQR